MSVGADGAAVSSDEASAIVAAVTSLLDDKLRRAVAELGISQQKGINAATEDLKKHSAAVLNQLQGASLVQINAALVEFEARVVGRCRIQRGPLTGAAHG